MDKQEKISLQQFVILVSLYTIGSSILITPNIVAMYGKNDGWITEILNLCIGLLLVAFYNKMAKSFQQHYYFEYIENIIGRWAGKALSLLYILFFILFASVLLGEVGDFMGTTIIMHTPIEPLIGLFVLIIIFGARYGIETLARSGEILFPWVFFLLLILLLLLIPQIKPEYLFPILGEGMKPILLSSYTSLGLPYLELFVLMILFPHVNHQEKRGKAFLLGVSIGGICIIIITLFAILVLGSEATARLHFPSYTMTKTISIANTIERIEAFLAGIWFLTIFMKISLVFYSITLYVKHLFNLTTNKVVMYPLGIILTVFPSFMISNVIHLREFVASSWTLFAGTFAVLIPMFLMGIETLKKWRTKKKEPLHH